MKKRASGLIIDNSKIIIIAFLIFSAVFFYGATQVSMESSLSQFQGNAPEVKAQDYISQNFTSPNQNQTTTQIIIRDNNVLSQQGLIEILRFQKELYNTEEINKTLENQSQPILSIANLIAITSIQQQKINKINKLSNQVQELKKEIKSDRKTIIKLINKSREIQIELDQLNYSYQANLINKSTYVEKKTNLKQNLTDSRRKANSTLNNTQFSQYLQIESSVLTLQHKIDDLNYKYENNLINQTEYQTKSQEYSAKIKQNYGRVQILFSGVIDEIDQKISQLNNTRSSLRNFTTPTIDNQISQIQNLSSKQLNQNISSVFNQTQPIDFNPFALMPLDFDPNSTKCNATMLFAIHKAPNTSELGQTTSDQITNAQKRIESISKNYFTSGEVMVMGQGLVSDEINRSMTDSLRIVLPIAILFVLVALIVAYRDALDILLGLFGILLVLVWTFGSMGLLGINFNQMFVSIPALLTGLSIDYAIHVFMRHREEREENPGEGTSLAMKIALSSVGMALIWVTATTVIGFLSSLSSPVPPVREFGIVSSIGIFSALLILGAFIPSIKVELDQFLEKRGFDRKKRAFGKSGRIESFLSLGSLLAKKKPALALVLVLLLTIAGGYGATKVNTTFTQQEFLAEPPPKWMDILPDQIEPGKYSIKQNLDYLNNNFLREDQEAQILIKGDVGSKQAISSLDEAQELAKQKNSTIKLSSGEIRINSPLTLINQIKTQNQSFKEKINKSDTDKDGLPDQNISEIYSELRKIAPEESKRLIYKSGDEYKAIRMIIAVKGTATSAEITKDMRDISNQISEQRNLNATATGSPVIFHVVETQIFNTGIDSLVIALVTVLVFISVAFKLVKNSAKLGFITILPVLVIVIWIVGTMYALDIPFNVMTAAITNLTIGLGIDYSIHISERFKHEIDEKEEDLEVAMKKTVTGTGGALLGTAATTIGGFGVLSLALLPPLKQFGIITAITMLYSFIAGVFILPSLLCIWAVMPAIEEDYRYPIQIKGLDKQYGSVEALKDLNLNIPGDVFGIVGPNGAGKTTLLNILAGAMKPTSGEVKVLGKDPRSNPSVRNEIGFLPENLGFYENMTGHDFLKYMAELDGLSGYEASKSAFNWLAKLGLDDWGDEKIKKYSAGMKQRLAIAQTFVTEPEVVLLDEPTSQLDPVGREEVLKIIQNYANQGRTVLISTHVLPELAEVADELAILKDGKLIEKTEASEVEDIEEYYKESIGE